MCSEKKLESYVDQAKRYLSEYLKIDTSDPLSECREAVDFWKKIYEKEEISYEIYTHESGKQSICGFVVHNGDIPSIVLLNHMDVVPAEEKDWVIPPFDGVDDGEYIHGRGAIDMKGLAIIQLAAALYAKELNKTAKLKRNIVILSVSDEEVGGFKGAKFVVDKYLQRLNPEVVLDEGAFGIREKSENLMYVSYSQRKSLWLKIFANGKQGHASQPSVDNANNILLKALEPLVKEPFRDADDKDELIKSAGIRGGRRLPEISRSLFSNTISVTSIRSKSAVNVHPQEAEAVLDCRLTPGTNVNEYIKKLHREIKDDRIRIEVIKRTDEVKKSDPEHKMLKVIKRVVKQNMDGTKVVPIVSPVGTDSKFFRERGIQSYGFFPILLDRSEIAMMHGVNEKISQKNIKLGIKIMSEVITIYSKGERYV